MEKQQIVEALQVTRTNSPKRNFTQTVDLVINLKNLDMKKPDNNIDQFINLHFPKGGKVKVCALVGPELLDQAKKTCDAAIPVEEFTTYKDKKAVKKLANQYDFFIAQANVMPKVATAFGRVFGPRGKMPNPKAGCVVPPNANLKQVYDKLQKTLRVATKNAPSVKCAVGKEDMKEEELIDNITTAYNGIVHALPNEEQNVKEALLKLTMGKPVKLGGKKEETKKDSKVEEKPKKEVPKTEEKAPSEEK